MAARPKPRGEEAIEQAFAKPRGQFCRDAMAEKLLNQAVAGREATGQHQMRNHVPQQAQHAERAGPHAVEKRKLAQQIEET